MIVEAWPTVACLRCGRVYSVHPTLGCPRLPLCIRCRRRRLAARERQLPLFQPTPEQILAALPNWKRQT